MNFTQDHMPRKVGATKMLPTVQRWGIDGVQVLRNATKCSVHVTVGVPDRLTGKHDLEIAVDLK